MKKQDEIQIIKGSFKVSSIVIMIFPALLSYNFIFEVENSLELYQKIIICLVVFAGFGKLVYDNYKQSQRDINKIK